MYYVGLDVHQNSTRVCILDDNGQIVKQKTVRGSWDRLVEYLREQDGPLAAVYEASCGYGALYDKLTAVCHSVTVAHPGKLRLIYACKRKNDKIDAQKLAELHYLGYIPKVWVPELDVREWREMINHRNKLIGDRTRLKNRIRTMLRKQGIRPKDHGVGRLWTKKGLAWLKELTGLRPKDQLLRDHLLDSLYELERQIKAVEQWLKKIGDDHPGVQLLMTIPGIGMRTAEAVMAYIDDPYRFKDINQVGSYFGLVPSQDQSGGRNYLGRITRQGPGVVRRLITEASWSARRYSPTIGAYFERKMRNDPQRKKKALVATGHYLLRVMLSMLKNGEVWEERLTPQAACPLNMRPAGTRGVGLTPEPRNQTTSRAVTSGGF